MVDMAHIAGLVAAKLHPSPVPYADIVTTTTHKTLRGPRGGLILCKKELAKKVDSAVFPGTQGGPLEHIVAGKLMCFIEADKPEFVKYQEQVLKNAKVMANQFKEEGFRIVAKTTDNHLVNVDVRSTLGISGKKAEALLHKINVVVNKNMIPFDSSSPFLTSGIRVGSPALTTRGFKEKEFMILTKAMASLLKEPTEENIQIQQKIVKDLLSKFPIYKNLKY
jgi:glycine hydroxymethyltransferase